MKSYTDIEQSKELAEILPIDSADMWFHPYPNDEYWYDIPNFGNADLKYNQLPCWSLAALLNILNNKAYSIDEDANVILSSYKNVEWNLSICNSDIDSVTDSDPIDACVEMAYKLKEMNLL